MSGGSAGADIGWGIGSWIVHYLSKDSVELNESCCHFANGYSCSMNLTCPEV